ncbi:MAG TPA: HNH endonuclease [Lapillicoccus sp.]|uniref:HNH endonuclease n=1 Tax=Lapillicoccus sp. TaxID=1909287 RepID=UPI002F922A18
MGHLDHVVDHAQGGPASVANGQGLCVRCHHTKQQPGWRARPEPAPPPGCLARAYRRDGHAHRPWVRLDRTPSATR